MVVAYQWRDANGFLIRELDALEWWPLSPGLIPRTDGRKGNWIAVADQWFSYPEPTHERLENGEVRPVPAARGEKYYNRSRRVSRSAGV